MSKTTSRNLGKEILDFLGIDTKGVTGFDLSGHADSAAIITIRRHVMDGPRKTGAVSERRYALTEIRDGGQGSQGIDRTDLRAAFNKARLAGIIDKEEILAMERGVDCTTLGVPDAKFGHCWRKEQPVSAVSTCHECNGTGRYQPLLGNAEQCRLCGGSGRA